MEPTPVSGTPGADGAFDILILIARPAAGKSEVIDYLKKCGDAERLSHFHLRPFEELDDFPMLWTWFEEDAILREMGHEGLHTDAEGNFLFPDLWNLLLRRISLEYRKKIRDVPDYHAGRSLIVEFSRGSEHGGYREAFRHLDAEILRRAAVLYIQVSWAESLRKNQKRFNPEKPDSILEHGLSDAKLERLYREVDWETFSAGDSGYLSIGGIRVPYAVMDNEDDVTTGRGPALGRRLEETLKLLRERAAKRGN